MRLTELAIQRLPLPEKGQKLYYDEVVKGLGIRISQGGARTFVFVHGKSRKFTTIGRFPSITLKTARTNASALKGTITAETSKWSKDEAVAAFLEHCQKTVSLRTKSDYKRLLNRHLPFGKISSYSRQKLLTALSDLASVPGEQSHASTAFNVFLNWCVANGHLDKNPIAGIRGIGRIKSRNRILDDKELIAIWNALNSDRHSKVVRMLIIMGQRRGELPYLSIEGDLATIPAAHTKNRRVHTFPVGELAKSHFEVVTFNGWSKAKRKLDKDSGVQDWTLHDLRRTFASNHARLGTPIHVVEKLLNHVSGSLAGVAGVYNRYNYMDEMTDAVHQYDEWLKSKLSIGG
jgi:integrase